MPSNIYDAFQSTYSVNAFRSVLEHPIVNNLILTAVILAFLLVLYSLTQEMYRHVLGDGGSYSSVIVRLIIVAALLGSYFSLVFGAVEIVDDFALKFIKSSTVAGSFNRNEDIVSEDQKAANQELNSALDEDESVSENDSKSFFGFSWGLPDLSFSQLLVQSSLFISQASLFIINAIRNISLTLLGILGPFAIITLLNRNLQIYGFGWIKSFVNVLSWPFLLALILVAQNILLDNLMTSSDIAYKTKMFGYNVVFIFYLFKIMKFIPQLAQGTAGSFSTFEGMMATALFLAAGPGGRAAKGAALLAGKGISGAGSIAKTAGAKASGTVSGLSSEMATRVSTRGNDLENEAEWTL